MGARHSNRKKRNLLKLLIILVFFILMIVSIVNILKWIKENKQSKKITAKILNNVQVIEEGLAIDFETLKEENKDTVGWIKVEGLNIEYPVVQAKDNSFYLSHSFDGSYNGAGWIFADASNKFDGTDKHIVIYGHNRRDGSMFGTLKKVLEKNWYEDENNKYIIFVTENGDYKYEVFSVYKVKDEDYYITTKFNSGDEFGEFIKTLKERSIYDFGNEVARKDKILTLSTCADNNKYRVVLHSKKVTD